MTGTATASTSAEKVGARENIRQVSVSPDGRRAAFLVAVEARGSSVQVVDLDKGGAPKSILRADGKPNRLQWCLWASNARLICQFYLISEMNGQQLAFSRLVSLDPAGGEVKVLSARETDRTVGVSQRGGSVIDLLADRGDGSILMAREYRPEVMVGTRLASTAEGLGVERVDPVTLRRSPVEPAKREAVEYIADGRGTVRIMGIRLPAGNGYESTRTSYQYRRPNSSKWEALSTVDAAAGKPTGFDPYAVDPDLNVAYGFESNDGRQALFSVALDGSLTKKLVFARPDVDIDGLVRIGRQRRVVGVSFATDRRQTAFFDPTLKALGTSLQKALPGQPIVTFVDASADESRLVLFVGSDVDPGRYMLFDKSTRKLEELLTARPELASTKLAEVRAVTFPARDGTMIPGYLTLPPGGSGKGLPAIVMPHGGPGARDEWGFDWLSQYFANQGFAVLQPNFRGSSGYGDAWFKDNGFKSWRSAVGDVNDGGRWLVSQGIAAPAKLAILGWSYGGYAALQSPVLDPDLFKAIVAIAPVTDLEALRTDAREFVNYRAVDAFIGQGAHIREGSPAQNATAIKAPVLLFHGNRDQNVRIGQSKLMADRLKDAGKQVEFVEYRDLDHYLDDSGVRALMLEKSTAFLRRSMGIAGAP